MGMPLSSSDLQKRRRIAHMCMHVIWIFRQTAWIDWTENNSSVHAASRQLPSFIQYVWERIIRLTPVGSGLLGKMGEM